MPIWKKFVRSLSQIIQRGPFSKRTSKRRRPLRKKGRIAKKLKSKSKSRSIKAAPQTLPPKEKTVPIGEITHFFSRIQVVVVKITKGEIVVGQKLYIKGKTTDFIQKVKSLQIESVDVKKARRGQLAGLKVDKEARPGDKVFKLSS